MTGFFPRRSGWVASIRFFVTMALVVGLVAMLAPPLLPHVAAAAFAPGTTVVVATDALNVRSGPGLHNRVERVLHGGEAVTVYGPTVSANGHVWIPISPTGWVVEEYLQPAPAAAPAAAPATTAAAAPGATTSFAAGDRVVVDAGALNFRVDPGTDSRVIRPLPYGTLLTISAGPVSANGYVWYQGTTTAATGATSGWAIGQAMMPAPVEMPDPGVMFDAGSVVHVKTDLLRLRSGPGTSFGTVALLPNGAILTITGGPVGADGHTWYSAATASGSSGWVAEQYVAFGESGGGIAVLTPGSPALVENGPLNFRQTPGLSGSIQAELPTGTWLMVVSGPHEANGYHWYEVDTANGHSGWVIGEALTSETWA